MNNFHSGKDWEFCSSMALEGLAALGLASNIVQFVDFGCRLFSQSKELYRSSSGLSVEAVELDNIAQSLGRLSDNLIVKHLDLFPIRPSSDDVDIQFQPANEFEKYSGETDLTLIATDCKKVADELSEALNQLRVKNPEKKWQCFRVTLTRIWKPERIDNMSRRLERFSNQLTICLIKVLQ